MSALFHTSKAGSVSLANRIVMAPMTRGRADANAAPGVLQEEYYSQRASAGLIITEGVSPSANGLGYTRTPGIYTPEQITAWRKVTDAVHAKGGRIAIQIMHVGRIANAANQPAGARVLAPSAIQAPGNIWTDAAGMQPYSAPEAMTDADIQDVIAEYAQAARNAREAGFDAIEFHAANGYLPNQFLSLNTNQRTDAYGGSPEKRIRFVLEAIDAMSAAWEPGRIGIRVSPAGTFNAIDDPEASTTYPLLARELAKRNLAWLHVVKPQSELFTQWDELRSAFTGTLIVNLGLNKQTAEELIASGQADLAAFGSPFIANPDFPERIRNNWPLAVPDQSTFYTPGAKGYTDYPAYA